MVARAGEADGYLLDIDRYAKRKSRKPFFRLENHLLPALVVVAEADYHRLAEIELTAKDHVARNLIKHIANGGFVFHRIAREESVILLHLRVFITDVEILQIMEHHAHAERQVLEPFGESRLQLKRYRLAVAPVIGLELHADVFDHDGCRKELCRVIIRCRQVERCAMRAVGFQLRQHVFHVRTESIFIQVPCPANIQRIFARAEPALRLPGDVRALHGAVSHVLQARLEGADAVVMAHVINISIYNIRKIDARAHAEAVVHAAVEQRRVLVRQAHVLILHGDEAAARCHRAR